MVVFVCEDSPEGIFTGVYDAWSSRWGMRTCGWKYRANIITACFRVPGGGGGSAQGAESRALGAQIPVRTGVQLDFTARH